jgi:hypothetical protein
MNAVGGNGGAHGVIQRLSITRPWHRRRRAPAAGRSSTQTRRRWYPRGTPSESVVSAWNPFGKCHLRALSGQVELRCNPDSQAAPTGWTPCARLPWLTGARKRTQCGRTVSQQARQGWYGRRRCSPGETFSCSQRKASTCATLAALAACKLRPKQKGVNHVPFRHKEKTKRTARCTAVDARSGVVKRRKNY